MNGRQLKVRCGWENSCGLEFADAQKYRRHCIEHIEANIAAARRLRNLPLPVETWTEVFSSCGPASLKGKMCFIRRQFHAIARPLLDGLSGRVLPAMGFVKSKQGNSAILRKQIAKDGGEYRLEDLCIAEVPPPQSVIGFQLIELKYFDAKVLSFLRAIGRLLLKDLHLGIGAWLSDDIRWENKEGHGGLPEAQVDNHYHNMAVFEHLLRLLPRLELAITTLQIGRGVSLISAELLARLLTSVRHLKIHALPLPDKLSLTDLHRCSPYIPVLVKWMHSPTEDGQQKLASLDAYIIADFAELVKQAQKNFLSGHSVPAVAYFVAISTFFWNLSMVELPFSRIYNERKEVLTLRRCDKGDGALNNNSLVLYRRSCVVGSSPEKEEQEDEAAENEEVEQLFLVLKRKFSESRNKLVLNVAQMSEITDEQLSKMEPFDEPQELGSAQEENNEQGPSAENQIE